MRGFLGRESEAVEGLNQVVAVECQGSRRKEEESEVERILQVGLR